MSRLLFQTHALDAGQRGRSALLILLSGELRPEGTLIPPCTCFAPLMFIPGSQLQEVSQQLSSLKQQLLSASPAGSSSQPDVQQGTASHTSCSPSAQIDSCSGENGQLFCLPSTDEVSPCCLGVTNLPVETVMELFHL